jgi:hypothetical protein
VRGIQLSQLEYRSNEVQPTDTLKAHDTTVHEVVLGSPYTATNESAQLRIAASHEACGCDTLAESKVLPTQSRLKCAAAGRTHPIQDGPLFLPERTPVVQSVPGTTRLRKAAECDAKEVQEHNQGKTSKKRNLLGQIRPLLVESGGFYNKRGRGIGSQEIALSRGYRG